MNSMALSLEYSLVNFCTTILSNPSLLRISYLSSMVFSSLIFESFWRTILGCGKKVNTTDSKLSLFEISIKRFRISWWPMWTPSKVPIVTIDELFVDFSLIFWNFIVKPSKFLWLLQKNIFCYTYFNKQK